MSYGHSTLVILTNENNFFCGSNATVLSLKLRTSSERLPIDDFFCIRAHIWFCTNNCARRARRVKANRPHSRCRDNGGGHGTFGRFYGFVVFLLRSVTLTLPRSGLSLKSCNGQNGAIEGLNLKLFMLNLRSRAAFCEPYLLIS